MNLSAITGPLTRTAGRSLLQLQKHSPAILTAVGVVGLVTAGVIAARQTLKLEPVLEDISDTVEAVKNRPTDLDWTEQDKTKDLVKVYVDGTWELIKLYGPAVTLGAASIVSIVSAHGILQRRNIALAAAYKTIEHAYSEYRKRVVEEFGPEKDDEFHRGIYSEKIKNEKTGKKELVKTLGDPNKLSAYARIFDERSSEWERNPEANLLLLRSRQNYLNDKLHARGHVFLNEVYDELGLERTQAGSVVGWIVSKGGDNYIDFGIYENPDSLAGYDNWWLLDFNVDGVIYDKI